MKKLMIPFTVLFFAFGSISTASAQIGKNLKTNLGQNKDKNENPKGYKPEADIAKLGGPFTDDGMTSEIHKKHSGEIVFSKNKIPMEVASEDAFSSSFNLSDNIYGRVFMPKSVENYPIYSTQFLRNGDTTTASHNKYGRLYYNIYVDGVKEKYWNVDVVDLSKQNLIKTTTYQVWLNPKPEDQKVSDEWKNIMNNLTDGEHLIKLEMIAGSPSSYSGA